MTAPSASADTELLRLETAVTAIAANLVDLDDNPHRKELDKTRLTGATAAAWADATNALTELWDGYRMLTELIGKARGLRDQRRLNDRERAEFGHLVLGKSVTLSTTTVPLAQRGLLGTGQISTTCSPAELLSAMEAAFGIAATVVTQAGEVWQRLLPAAADTAAELDHVRRLTRDAGGSTATLDEADRRLGAFTGLLASDPLGIDEWALDGVRELITRADAERTSAAELRKTQPAARRDPSAGRDDRRGPAGHRGGPGSGAGPVRRAGDNDRTRRRPASRSRRTGCAGRRRAVGADQPAAVRLDPPGARAPGRPAGRDRPQQRPADRP
jgi:hypothetical protein